MTVAMGKLGKNQSGFSAVEVAIILVIIGVLGLIGWFVYESQRNIGLGQSSKSTTQEAKTSKNSDPADQYVGWERYCSDSGGICFKYPSGWQPKTTETSDPSINGLNLISPSGKIMIGYTPALSGFGGVCEPGNCFFQPSTITKPIGTNTGTLKIVKGIYTNNGGENVVPFYFVSDDSNIANYKLSVGEKTDVGFFIASFSNPVKGNVEGTSVPEVMSIRDMNQPKDGYGSLDVANAWFDNDEVVTAGKILSSVEVK